MDNKLINHIQFLRAIAVLLVFFYHLKFNLFEYGFIGVDIFFVISGYVITSRIFYEFEKKGKFDFLNFYKKRLKRIYPVLIFILSFSFLIIIFFQPLDLFLNNLQVYFFTLFGISNLYYLFSEKDYFDTVFNDPFSHTWSLGVEEQFYLIFPIFFIFLLTFVKNINNKIIWILCIIIAGIILTYVFSNDIKITFYFPFFRLWEFLFGSLTFLISINFKPRNLFLSIISFLLLIIIIVTGKYFNNFSLLVFSSILSSMFVLFYQNNNDKIFFFENKFLIFLGNISYSFYLWHLPTIYFYDLYFINNFFRIPILFITNFILSTLTFLYIEQKFRYKKFNININFKKLIFTASFLALLFITISEIAFKKSYENKYKNYLKKIIYKINYLENSKDYTNRTVFYKINIDGNQIFRFCTQNAKKFILNRENLRSECLKKGNKKNRLFYLEGNSYTANFIPMFNSLRIDDYIYYEHKVNPLLRTEFKKINNLKNFYNEVIYTTNINTIEDLENLKKVQRGFDNNIKILILGPIPNIDLKIDPLKCFIKSKDCSYKISKDIESRNLIELNSKINETLKNESNYYYFDPYKSICKNEICYVYNTGNDVLTHRDHGHFTIEGSLLMKKDFESFYQKFFKK